MATDLTKLKCRDCCKRDNMGWGKHFCGETGLPIGLDQPACISVLPKNTKHNGKTRD